MHCRRLKQVIYCAMSAFFRTKKSVTKQREVEGLLCVIVHILGCKAADVCIPACTIDDYLSRSQYWTYQMTIGTV